MYKSSIILHLLFLILFIGCAAVQKGAADLNSHDFKAVTLSRDTVSCFSENYKKTLLVFYNNYSCGPCFAEIGNFLTAHQADTSLTEVVVVGRVGTASLNRRNAIKQGKEFIPFANRVVFDIQKEADNYPPVGVSEGIFGQLKIDKTPAILIWNNAKGKAELFLEYPTLIGKDGKLSNSVKKEIDKLLSH